jgi:hypothetical protein
MTADGADPPPPSELQCISSSLICLLVLTDLSRRLVRAASFIGGQGTHHCRCQRALAVWLSLSLVFFVQRATPACAGFESLQPPQSVRLRTQARGCTAAYSASPRWVGA